MQVHVEDGESPKHSPLVKKNKFKKNKILIISVVGAILCMALGAYLLFVPATPVPVNETVIESPHYNIDLSYDVGVNPGAYDQHLIKITHNGGDSVENMSGQLWMSVYPPDGTPYEKRSWISHTSKYLSFEEGDVLYIYLGKDQLFYASKELPDYDEYVDFPDGDWGIHIDDARYKTPFSQYKFTIENSKTHLITKKSSLSINQMLDQAQPYDSIFIFGDQIYHEQVIMESKTLRLYGVGGPTIDAGGENSAIMVSNCSGGEIFGFNIQNSGTREFEQSGILLKDSDHMLIRNNSIHDNQNGIFLASSNENDIRYNYIQANDISGIAVTYGSSKNTIKNNYIAINTMGIYISDSSDSNYVVLNTGKDNTRYGLYIDNTLKNMYEYNDFGNDRMSYERTADAPITYYSEDKYNESAWLDPNRTLGAHESRGPT
jgi:parallel beta-helix repeat protein